MKKFEFQKNKHQYSFKYDDVKELINYIVDIADTDGCHIDLIDVFVIVRALATKEGTGKASK